jgi:hypothetical protein
MRRSILILLLLLFATPALAVDGVLEINQTCAVQTGCIDNSGGIGDTPGFPVTIEVPGSYVLTSNLIVSDPNKHGISIATAPVTIDLNGFEIQGPVNCNGLGSTLTCDAGTGSGIRSSFVRSSVMNGSVIKFGSDGVQLGGRSQVRDLVVERNGGKGIDVGGDSLVSRSRAYRNATGGVGAGANSMVKNVTATSNGSHGIEVGGSGVVRESTANDNGGSGIDVGEGSNVSESTACDNGAHGIRAQSSVVSSNVACRNAGFAAIVSTDDGSVIRGNSVVRNERGGVTVFGDGSTVLGNVIRGNGTSGSGRGLNFDATSGSTYRGNTITENATQAVMGAGVNLGDNYCAGTGVVSASCP